MYSSSDPSGNGRKPSVIGLPRGALAVDQQKFGFGADCCGFAHKVSVSNDPRRSLLGRITSRDDRKAIDQASPTPVNQFLAQTIQAVLCAERAEQLSSHIPASMMCPIENLRFDQR